MNEVPALIAELCEMIGLEAALRLVEIRGGRSIYVPSNLGPEHTLSKTVGYDNACRVAARYPRETIDIPRCAELMRRHRDDELRKRYAEGESANELAGRYRMTERNVRRILSASPEECARQVERDARQLKLFP